MGLRHRSKICLRCSLIKVRPRRPLQQTAGPFCSQREAVAAACLDHTPLYLGNSTPKHCNKTALDAVRQTIILRLRGAKIGEIKVA